MQVLGQIARSPKACCPALRMILTSEFFPSASFVGLSRDSRLLQSRSHCLQSETLRDLGFRA